MILNDDQIREANIITPFIDHQVNDGVLSYGLSSFGYDIRLGYQFIIPSWDPKSRVVREKFYKAEIGKISPGTCLLAETIEHFRMPEDVLGIVTGKSSYARCGIIINCTPLEPGWEGILTIEISNTNQSTVSIYPGEGIAQVMFFKGSRPSVTYSDRKGKYQNQKGVTSAFVQEQGQNLEEA